MFEKLKETDKEVLLFINNHHNLFFDNIMWFASDIKTWYPLYAIILILLFIKFKKKTWLIILLIILLLIWSDMLSSGIIKPLTHRLRPSHQPGLMNLLHYVHNYRGGLYSFPSSHATNFFAGVTFICLVASKKIKWLYYFLIPIAVLVSYSRMYLGVHFPTDVAAGAILGVILGWIFSKIYFSFFSPETSEIVEI